MVHLQQTMTVKEQIPGRVSMVFFPRKGHPNTNTTDMLYYLVPLKTETSMTHENLLSLKSILNEERNF